MSNKKSWGNLSFNLNRKKGELSVEIDDLKRVIPWAEFWLMVFDMSGDNEQEDLLPTSSVQMMEFTKHHAVKVKNDMKAGETMFVDCHVSVPKTIVDSLSADIEKDIRKKLK